MERRKLTREFKVEAVRCKWVEDFSYLWTAEGWLYVVAVVDLFSRLVSVGL